MGNSDIHLVKAAFHLQFKTAMESCGVSPDYYFKKVGLPTEVSDPENLNLGPVSKLIAYTLIKPQTPVLNGQETSS